MIRNMKVMDWFTAWPGVPPAECAHDGTGKLQCPFLTRAHRVPRTACHAGPVFSLTSGIRQPLPTGSQTTAEPRLFHVLPKASDSIGPLCSCRALLLLPAWAIGEPLVKHRPLRCGISMPARHRNNRTSKKMCRHNLVGNLRANEELCTESGDVLRLWSVRAQGATAELHRDFFSPTARGN